MIMAKWYGIVGYITTEETEPGIYKPVVTEKPYFGDLLKNISKWSPTTRSTNDDLNISNQISIVADPFAYQNFSAIKFVEFMGAMWEVTSAEVQYPRLILTVGGVWNGERAQTEFADEV